MYGMVNEWIKDAGDGFQTSGTLPLAVQPTDVAEDPEVVARLRTREDENGTLMQSDLNNELFYTLFNQRRNLLRVTVPVLTLFKTLLLRVMEL